MDCLEEAQETAALLAGVHSASLGSGPSVAVAVL